MRYIHFWSFDISKYWISNLCSCPISSLRFLDILFQPLENVVCFFWAWDYFQNEENCCDWVRVWVFQCTASRHASLQITNSQSLYSRFSFKVNAVHIVAVYLKVLSNVHFRHYIYHRHQRGFDSLLHVWDHFWVHRLNGLLFIDISNLEVVRTYKLDLLCYEGW